MRPAVIARLGNAQLAARRGYSPSLNRYGAIFRPNSPRPRDKIGPYYRFAEEDFRCTRFAKTGGS